MNSNKIVHLECARGIASVIVMFHHFALAFAPGVKATVTHGGLRLTPLYVLLNGGGAVAFFFFLSGFVLTQRFFAEPSPTVLAASLIKRLPRLMIPASASIFIGFLILSYGIDYYKTAADISHSTWLMGFANGGIPRDLIPSAADAAKQSLLVFLLPGHFYYNSNLWTMFDEFYGSLLVFTISFFFLFKRATEGRAMVIVHVFLIVVLSLLHHALVPFVAGSLLSYFTTAGGMKLAFSNTATVWLLMAATVGFSVDSWVLTTPASLCVMLALLGNGTLARHLSGRIGSLLGTLSFPLYLVHTLVITSLSSYVYVHLSGMGWTESYYLLPVLLVVTLAASLVICTPLVLIDSFWTRWLNANVKRLVAMLAAGGRTAAQESARSV